MCSARSVRRWRRRHGSGEPRSPVRPDYGSCFGSCGGCAGLERNAPAKAYRMHRFAEFGSLTTCPVTGYLLFTSLHVSIRFIMFLRPENVFNSEIMLR